MQRPRPKFKVSFHSYFCCFWINVTQINFENIKRKIQRIISDSCFQLKSWFNVDARAPSIPQLNFPFKKIKVSFQERMYSHTHEEIINSGQFPKERKITPQSSTFASSVKFGKYQFSDKPTIRNTTSISI